VDVIALDIPPSKWSDKKPYNMEKQEMLWLASKAADKGWVFETLKYCDDLYGKEQYADEIWEYVDECRKIGTDAFYEKYKDYKLYL
jgi:hypothetical protein